MDKIPPSSIPPKSELPVSDKKYSPQKWMRVWGRFIRAVAKDVVKNRFSNSSGSEQNGTGINTSSIEHLTPSNMNRAELLALAKARVYEKRGKFIKANWLRAKASEKMFASPESRVHHFCELGRGGEGRTDLVFKGTAGPLEVKKSLDRWKSSSKAEIALLKRLDHPNIIKILPNKDRAKGKKRSYIMKNGGVALAELVPSSSNPVPLPRPRFVSIVKQMAEVLDYLRKEKVLHRDIKPLNIVIDQAGHISLIDFGMAYDRQTNTPCCSDGIGTFIFREPDALSPRAEVKYSDTGDMFATGQTLFSLLTGAPLKFPEFYRKQGLRYGHKGASWDAYKKDLGLTKIIATTLAETLKNQPQAYIMQVTDLITRMLEPDPKLRITPEELKNHPLLSDQQPPSR